MVENNIKLYRGLFPIKWQKHVKKTRGKIFCTFAPLMLLRGHSKSMYAQIWKFWSSSLLHTFIRFKKTHSCFLCFTYISPFPFPPPPHTHTHTHTYIYRKFVKPRFYIFIWITNKRLKMSKYIIFTTNNYYTYFLSKDKTWGPFLLWNMTSL